MIKMKITATKGELEKTLEIIKQKFSVMSISNAVRNRNSLFYRTYVTVSLLDKESE